MQEVGYTHSSFLYYGGARMQEGIFSLMQMAKTSMAVKSFLKPETFIFPI